MAANVPNLMKDMNINIQETQGTKRTVNWMRPISRNFIIKLSKDKERTLSWKHKEKGDSSHTKDSQWDYEKISYQKPCWPKNIELVYSKEKNLSTRNSISDYTILQKWEQNQDILR